MQLIIPKRVGQNIDTWLRISWVSEIQEEGKKLKEDTANKVDMAPLNADKVAESGDSKAAKATDAAAATSDDKKSRFFTKS